MKTLSLTQPWASLIAIGAKRVETRSWSTNYRGPLAIHASKGFPADARNIVYARMVRELLKPHFPSDSPLDKQLPLGCVIATCKVVDRIGAAVSRRATLAEWPGLSRVQNLGSDHYPQERFLPLQCLQGF